MRFGNLKTIVMGIGAIGIMTAAINVGAATISVAGDSANDPISKISSIEVVSTLIQYQGISPSDTGNLFAVDSQNSIMEITSPGMVGTFATEFSDPTGPGIDNPGNLYVGNGVTGTIGAISPTRVVNPTPFATGVQTGGLIAVQSAPEPSLVALFITGGLGLLARRRRCLPRALNSI